MRASIPPGQADVDADAVGERQQRQPRGGAPRRLYAIPVEPHGDRGAAIATRRVLHGRTRAERMGASARGPIPRGLHRTPHRLRPTQNNNFKQMTQIMKSLLGKFEKVRVHEPRGVTVASVKLLDVSGRPLGSAERAAVYNATRQVFRRATKPGQAESAGEESEWEIKNLQGKPSLVEMMGHNSNGEVFTRVSNLTKVDNIVIVPPPFNIELNPSSQLITRPGQALQLTYDVTNNLDIPQLLVFYMRDQLAFLQRVVPVQFLVPPRKTIPVVGYLGISQSATEGQTDRVNFHAQSQTIQREIIKSSVVYVQQEQTSDVWSPSIWGTWKSTCTGAWDTATCATNTWTIDFEIQDRDSGLLSVITYPKGIQFRTDFVSGTREKVIAYYTASCCSKKVEVIATDLRGNTNRQTFDVGSQFLNAGEIAGISVGVIALILIVIIIVLAILLCRRRESLRLERRLSSRLAAREVR